MGFNFFHPQKSGGAMAPLAPPSEGALHYRSRASKHTNLDTATQNIARTERRTRPQSVMRNDSRDQLCDCASDKFSTTTTTISLNPPFNVREIDSFAEVSNRDIFPFVGMVSVLK